MESTRKENAQESPRASGQLAQARKELQDMDTVQALSRSARDVENGRVAQAASNDPVISDTLQRLQQTLANAAETAAAEAGARQQGRRADADDLVAEIGSLRRALDRAREQSMAQDPNGNRDPNAQGQQAQEGQRGQSGGQQGQHGQGGQGQQGQQGQQQAQNGQRQPGQQQGQGQQGGQPGSQGGSEAGGRGDRQVAGIGNQNGGAGAWRGGRVGSVALNGTQRELLRNQTQLSADNLARLREQLASGVLNPADAQALLDLERRLRRGDVNPASADFQGTLALVNQLELAALKAQQLAKNGNKSTHVDETVDDSRRYRDNVAEYYRRLGGGND
jgi:hypothetical protein